MKWQVQTLSHPPLNFIPAFPAGFAGMRLAGAAAYSATGSFGEIVVQEYDGEGYFIRHSTITTREPLVLEVKSQYSGMHVAIALRNQLRAVFMGTRPMQLGDGQFTILQGYQPQSNLTYAGREQYIELELSLSPPIAQDLLAGIDRLILPVKDPSPSVPEIWIDPPEWIDDEVRHHVRQLLNYDDDAGWRDKYFGHRVRDIFFRLLMLHGRHDTAGLSLTTDERVKALQTERLILDNLARHLLISDLAKRIGASESRLKKIFNRVFGMGMHEYRIKQRLKHAIELLNEGASVKEAAAQTGWRSAELIKAYYKKYGSTPGKLKRRR